MRGTGSPLSGGMMSIQLELEPSEGLWQRDVRNAELGKMFAWIGCVCQALWVWGMVWSLHKIRPIDLTGSSVYLALAFAGLMLLVRPNVKTVTGGAPAGAKRPPPLRHDSNAVCRILVVGPMESMHHELKEALESSRIARFEHIESPAYAQNSLGWRPDGELPQIVIVASFLPVVTPLDFVARLQNDERLRSIPVVVCGRGLDNSDIKQLYDAGAASVIPGVITDAYLMAMREFCAAAVRNASDPR